MVKYYVTSSKKGMSIVFPNKEDYDRYERDLRCLIVKHKKLQQETIGYWASNQDKFVKELHNLNDLDDKSYHV